MRRARQKSEARPEAILETAADGIMTLAANGTIESFNPSAEAIFGYSAYKSPENTSNVSLLRRTGRW